MGFLVSRISDCENAVTRDEFVLRALTLQSQSSPAVGKRLLDIGAGNMPYREIARTCGFSYRSHDFALYDGIGDGSGLQDGRWQTSGHDVVCDILDIPSTEQADIVLCTEVLEHVPDPVRTFGKLTQLCRPGGQLIITVPLLSLMHQAPFWFQSGLSPYWFEYWSSHYHLTIEELLISGDYADLMRQELRRASSFLPKMQARLLRPITTIISNGIRKQAPRDVLLSGGFNTFFIGTKAAKN